MSKRMRRLTARWRDRVAERLPLLAPLSLATAPEVAAHTVASHTTRQHWRSWRHFAWPVMAIVLSCSLLVTTVGLDGFLNRGIVYGTPPTTNGGLLLGMNVFLEKEANPDNITTSIRMLKEAHVTFVRQSFPWAEIEPAPGVYRDPKSGQDTWAKYDRLVNALHDAGIGILARVDTIPRWARPQTDDFAHYDKGPPQDFNNYANFVGVLADRYRGKISYFQVWNEPNLDGEWGGKPISPQQYGLLLQYTYKRVKAVNPAALIVTAGLAQTTENGKDRNNLNELAFIQGLYDAGAQPYFDILSVMDYGLGHSPEDRRVSPDRTNFSRLQLAHDIMARNGDAAKPIWISEYGWISLPADWSGNPSTWGASVDENTQAQYMIEGLDRIQREWPWVGAVFVWGFRWVEPPQQNTADPARYFEVVDYDFAPRPAYLALKNWSAAQAVANSGLVTIYDARLDWQGPWRDQQLAGHNYRVATTPGASVRLPFHGTAVTLDARTGPNRGRLYVTIDGKPVRGLPADANGTYVSLRNSQVVDDQLPLASNLLDGDHLLELRSSDTGEVAIEQITIGRRMPFPWVAPVLFAASWLGLFFGLFLLGRAALLALGWLRPAAPPPVRPYPAWWDTRE
jgi:polysaccharide biosynthesis protein PslG